MFDQSGERHIQAFLYAARCAIDSKQPVSRVSRRYVLGGGVGSASQKHMVAAARSAQGVNADYTHLEFARGSEEEGPVNLKVGFTRSDVVNLHLNCRFWQGGDGRMLLVSTAGIMSATMSFGPDGPDLRTAPPFGDLEGGYARATARLRKLAAEALASNDFGSTFSLRHAA